MCTHAKRTPLVSITRNEDVRFDDKSSISLIITKTRLYKYTENFTTKK